MSEKNRLDKRLPILFGAICLSAVPAIASAGASQSSVQSINGSDAHSINGSDVRSINGSDLRSINGSDVRSINGSDVRSINGSDLRSINGSDVLSINGSDVLSINGSDVRSINGSDVRSINGSDLRSINGSDVLSINGSDVLSINGSDLRSINGSDVLSINGSDLRSINGSDLRSINGSDALSINGSDVRSINGSDLRSINGSDALSINGSDVRSINGSDLRSINGSDVLFAAFDGFHARYIDISGQVAKSGSFAIGVQPSLFAVAPIQGVDHDRSTVTVLGGEVGLARSNLSSLTVGDLVAVFGSRTSTGVSVATSLAKLGSASPSTSVDVFVQGTVGAVDRGLGLITVGGISVDYTPLLANGPLPNVGAQIALVGTRFAGSPLVVAK